MTVDSFNAWRIRFTAEMKQLKLKEEEDRLKSLPPKERDEAKRMATKLTGAPETSCTVLIMLLRLDSQAKPCSSGIATWTTSTKRTPTGPISIFRNTSARRNKKRAMRRALWCSAIVTRHASSSHCTVHVSITASSIVVVDDLGDSYALARKERRERLSSIEDIAEMIERNGLCVRDRVALERKTDKIAHAP